MKLCGLQFDVIRTVSADMYGNREGKITHYHVTCTLFQSYIYTHIGYNHTSFVIFLSWTGSIPGHKTQGSSTAWIKVHCRALSHTLEMPVHITTCFWTAKGKACCMGRAGKHSQTQGGIWIPYPGGVARVLPTEPIRAKYLLSWCYVLKPYSLIKVGYLYVMNGEFAAHTRE